MIVVVGAGLAGLSAALELTAAGVEVTVLEAGDEVARGERISLIQFGSRCDVYLPLTARISVKLGDRVVGGETVLAVLA